MRGADHKQSPLFSYVNLEDRIPRDHPLRRVKVLADLVLRSMSAHFDALYAEGGRPSIAPERLLRASLLQMLVFDPLGTRAGRTYRLQHDVPLVRGPDAGRGDLGSLDVLGQPRAPAQGERDARVLRRRGRDRRMGRIGVR